MSWFKYISIILFLAAELSAQKYYFNYFDKDEGLIQSQVAEIAQDEEGYLWLLTLGGVSRFDGSHFDNYTEENGLNNKRAFCIYTEFQSGVWIGGVGEVQHFINNEWVTYQLPKGHESEKVRSIVAYQGKLLVSTLESGVYVLLKDRFTPWSKVPDDYQVLKLKRHDEVLWMLSKKEIAYLDEAQNAWVVLNNLSSFRISDFDWDSQGGLWLATLDHGLVHQKDSNVFVHNTQSGLLSNEGNAVMVDQEDRVWMSSQFGVSCFQNQSIYNFGTFNGLKNDFVKSVFQDYQGNIWMGTYGSGLCKFSGFHILHFDRLSSFCSDYVLGIEEGEDGTMWFGTYDQGLCHLDANGRFQSFNTQNSGLKSDRVWALEQWASYLWVGTGDGLMRFDPSTESWLYINEANGLLHHKVLSLAASSEGLWVGTQNGVVLFDDLGNVRFQNEDARLARAILVHQNKVYLACDKGLGVYQNGKIVWYNKPKAIGNAKVNSLTALQDEVIIGTSRGLFAFIDKQWVEWNYPSVLGQKDINFLKAQQDYLWIGTQNGVLLGQKDPQKQNHIKIQQLLIDDLGSSETNQNAVYLDQKNRVWLGTDGGMTCILNIEPFSKYVLPKVYLEDVKLFMEGISEKKKLKAIFKPSENHLTFQYKSIAFMNANEIAYEYTLEGFDEKWIGPIKSDYVTYSNLSPGDYTFRLKLKSIIDYQNSSEISYSFTILPPIYLRLWFIGLVVLFLTVSTYVIYKWRVKVVQEKMRMGQIESESKLKILEQKSLNASMNRHFIFNALNSIQYYINRQDRLSANRYLTKFARLIRLNLDSTQSNLVALSKELERLELYLELEQMRFENISYEISVDDALDLDDIQLPAMMLQPFVENSIIHGLLPLENSRPGLIQVSFNKTPLGVQIIIEDNGIGLKESLSKKTENGDHTSHGMEITSSRFELFGSLLNKKVSINGPNEIYDKEGKILGTKVYISIGV